MATQSVLVGNEIVDQPAASPAPVAPAQSAALAPASSKGLLAELSQKAESYGTLVGAAGGLYYGYTVDHPVLGLIGGATLGSNLPKLMKPGQRAEALTSIGIVGVATYASAKLPAMLPKFVPGFLKHPVAGYIVGAMAATAAAKYIPGAKTADSMSFASLKAKLA